MAEAGFDIVDIPLEGSLAGYDRPGDGRSVLFVFWRKGIPLGRALVNGQDLPVSAAALAALAATSSAAAVAARLGLDSADASGLASRLLAIDDPLALSLGADEPSATADLAVIVCTRGRPAHLETCLESLAGLDPAPGDILVVGNDPPGDDTSRVVVEKFPRIRFVAEPVRGLSRARNTGLQATRKSIIAFTDDDVIVAPNWAATIAASFAREGVDGMTGIVLPRSVEGAGQAYFELQIGALFKGFVPRMFEPADLARGSAEVWMIGAGANMAFRRNVFERLGGFDERLGAGASGCSEDSEFWYRMLAAGCRIAYRPDCVVHHAHRASDVEIERQLQAYMRGHVAALLVQFARHGHAANLRRALIRLPAHLVRKWVAARRASDVWRRRFAASELRGCLAGLDPRYLKRVEPPPIE